MTNPPGYLPFGPTTCANYLLRYSKDLRGEAKIESYFAPAKDMQEAPIRICRDWAESLAAVCWEFSGMTEPFTFTGGPAGHALQECQAVREMCSAEGRDYYLPGSLPLRLTLGQFSTYQGAIIDRAFSAASRLSTVVGTLAVRRSTIPVPATPYAEEVMEFQSRVRELLHEAYAAHKVRFTY